MSEKKVTVRQEGKEDKVIDAPEGAVFLQVLKMNGYSLVCCNGKGTCGHEIKGFLPEPGCVLR